VPNLRHDSFSDLLAGHPHHACDLYINRVMAAREIENSGSQCPPAKQKVRKLERYLPETFAEAENGTDPDLIGYRPMVFVE